jgi:MFS superfamily sulfate permease-like transporter
MFNGYWPLETHIIAQRLSNTLSGLLSGYPVTLGL